MHLILTGATGLVGSAVLRSMLHDPAVTKITLLSRRAVPQAAAHSKATTVIVPDFASLPPTLAPSLSGAHGVVWAQGISQTQVSAAEYGQITLDFPLGFAKFALANGLFGSARFVFVHVSGEGATRAPGRLTPRFGRVKGEAEAALEELAKKEEGFKIYNVRPGGVDPIADPEIAEFIPKASATVRAFRAALHPLANALAPNLMSPTKELGRGLLELVKGDGGPLDGKGTEDWQGRTVVNARVIKIGSDAAQTPK